MKRSKFCVGCQELRSNTQRVEALGHVCADCSEVLDIVCEVELQRLREARRTIGAFIAELRGGTL